MTDYQSINVSAWGESGCVTLGISLPKLSQEVMSYDLYDQEEQLPYDPYAPEEQLPIPSSSKDLLTHQQPIALNLRVWSSPPMPLHVLWAIALHGIYESSLFYYYIQY